MFIMKHKLILFLTTLLIAVGFFVYSLNSNSWSFQSIESLFSQEQRSKIKKFILPYSYIKNQEDIIYHQNTLIEILNKVLPEKELLFVESGGEILLEKPNTEELSNGKLLYKYKLNGGFYFGLNNKYPGSGFIDFYEDNLVMLSARGVVSYVSDLNNLYVSL